MKQTLFYPCSGQDIRESVRTWQHIVDEFWFAEVKFVRRRRSKEGEEEVEWRRLPIARIAHSMLVAESETVLTGDQGEAVPVKSHIYHHEKLRKSITLHFAAGCAVETFNCLPFENISVFVNRGDHRVRGESSSGICWLSDEGSSDFPNGMLKRVLSKLSPGGFVVTDGSNATAELAPHWNESEFVTDIHLAIDPVTLHGTKLRCVGMLEPKYGPTLVWQVM